MRFSDYYEGLNEQVAFEKGDPVVHKNSGRAGKVANVSGDKSVADVNWNDGSVSSEDVHDIQMMHNNRESVVSEKTAQFANLDDWKDKARQRGFMVQKSPITKGLWKALGGRSSTGNKRNIMGEFKDWLESGWLRQAVTEADEDKPNPAEVPAWCVYEIMPDGSEKRKVKIPYNGKEHYGEAKGKAEEELDGYKKAHPDRKFKLKWEEHTDVRD